MKKRVCFIALIILCLMIVAFVAVQAKVKFLSIATGGTGGTYYPLGEGIATIINSELFGIRSTAEVTGASVENCRLVENGAVELAFVQNDVVYYAYTGTEFFKSEKMQNIRGIALLYPEVIQIVTTEKSGIKSVIDFKGKRIAVGAPGSGTEANARQIIEAHGLKFADMKVEYLSFAEAIDQLKAGHIDAAFVTAGIPTGSILDLSTSRQTRLVHIESSVIETLRKQYPYYTSYKVKAGTYHGLEKDIQTVTVMAMLVTNKDVEEQLVYDMTKAVFSNLDRMAETHSRGQDIQIHTALNGMPIELHPGAKRYFREAYADVLKALGY